MKTVTELRHKDLWIGTYRGVLYEIVRWSWDTPLARDTGHDENWNYYLYLRQGWFSQADWAQLWLPGISDWYKDCPPRVSYGYNDSPLDGLAWHCGITYYHKAAGWDWAEQVLKVGCDYLHYWDEGNVYNEIMLRCDAQETIDNLWQRFPTMATAREGASL